MVGTDFFKILATTACLTCTIVPLAYPSTPDPFHVEYHSPATGSLFVAPGTNIILRFSDAIDASGISATRTFIVEGSKSGRHTGTLKLADDGQTLLFKPDKPFAAGERVSVTLSSAAPGRSGEVVQPFTFAFSTSGVKKPMPTYDLADELQREDASIPSTWQPQPSTLLGDTLPLDFPYVKSSILGSESGGRIFLSNFAFFGTYVPYLLILSDSGAPVFYRRMPARCTDFKLQSNGLLTYFQDIALKFYAMDSVYAVTDSFMTGNGYTTDLHELRLLPNGHALLMAYDPQTVDMSGIVPGGKTNATVTGLIIQEIDQQKDVVFQWRSWDHFQITDATHEDLTAQVIDYAHGNAIEADTDGNILISSRHMDEITKISRSTGEIIWRLGGKNNQFTFVNDSLAFSHQHAIRRQSNGNITLYDNGNYHSPPFSRAAEYRLDEQQKIATLVWQYRHTPDVYGSAMGYVQRLENGNTLIGWGSTKPAVVEVRADGSKVYELELAQGIYSYRAYRFHWKDQNQGGNGGGPTTFSLSQNYPNPFNNSTTIQISLTEDATVTFKIYDVLGRLVSTQVEDQRRSRGNYVVYFDGSSLATGTYFYRLTGGNFSVTRKMQKMQLIK